MNKKQYSAHRAEYRKLISDLQLCRSEMSRSAIRSLLEQAPDGIHGTEGVHVDPLKEKEYMAYWYGPDAILDSLRMKLMLSTASVSSSNTLDVD